MHGVDPTFVSRFMTYKGIPYWDEALVLPYDDRGGVGVMIPVTDGNILKGVFMGYYQNDTTRLRVDYLPKNENTYNVGDDFAILCNYFSWRIRLFDAVNGMEFELIQKPFETTMTKSGTIDGGCIDAVTCIGYRPNPPSNGFTGPTIGGGGEGGSMCPSLGGIGDKYMNQIDRDANSSDYSPEEEDKEPDCSNGVWDENSHNRIVSNAFPKLSNTQIGEIQLGSIDADDYQGIKYNHIHAQRTSDQSIAEAVALMRAYVIDEISQFLLSGSYFILGRALHPIMDAYSPPHKGFQPYDSYWDLIKHWDECDENYPIDAGRASSAINTFYYNVMILPKNATPSQIGELFDYWLNNYVQEIGMSL